MLLPGYILFGWFHSLIKLYALFTLWNISWSGRKDLGSNDVVGNGRQLNYAHRFMVNEKSGKPIRRRHGPCHERMISDATSEG